MTDQPELTATGIEITAETHDALVALGWTPPGEAVRHVTINMSGPVLNDRDLYDAVQRQTLIRQRRNPGNG